MHPFSSENFHLEVLEHAKKDGVMTTRLHITDRFDRPRHTLERKAFGAFSHQLEKYLAKHPELHFGHQRNIAQKLVYLPPSLRSWAAFMPGAFATHPVHNPDVRYLATGKKIDYLTRNLFRHSIDAIGLRSRAYAMAWYINKQVGDNPSVRWLSLASGTGQQTFDAAMLLDHPPTLYITDIDDDAMRFSASLAKDYKFDKTDVIFEKLNATDEVTLANKLQTIKPQIIDMMGLMEYLDDNHAVEVVKTIIQSRPESSCFVFTTMLPSHPELNLHKRGLGWPGVIVRSVQQVLTLLEQAEIPVHNIEVLLPDDKVYAVFCIKIA